MKLSTTVNIPKSNFNLTHEHSILLVGSCFATAIGDQLAYHKFDVKLNPFGVIYNPHSIAKSLDRIIKNESYSEDALIQYDEQWLSFDHHGSYSKDSREACAEDINEAIALSHEMLKNAEALCITFGSAWIYEYEGFGVVANCHKMPAKNFTKRLLSVKEIIAQYENLITSLKTFNPSLKIIFTVSPVRHTKDGLNENNLSKGTLHLAIHHVVSQHQNCSYFPAYEIVVDELRDYRFYKDDLVHPTAMAIDIVWNRFSDTFFEDQTKQLNASIAKIQQALAHRPFNKNSAAHLQFKENTLLQIKQLQEKLPGISF